MNRTAAEEMPDHLYLGDMVDYYGPSNYPPMSKDAVEGLADELEYPLV